MEAIWQREALLAGMSANAFKLGTTLTLGWFWFRVAGCSVLYRGRSMEQIDFANVLAVGQLSISQMQPPTYLQHSSGSTYFYAVRRVNRCGNQEHTLKAAVKVSIGANGDLALPQPNSILQIKVKQIAGNKVQLVWSYYPLKQRSQPICFNVYSDDGTGQINYENPVAVVAHIGRRLYSYQSGVLSAERYLFAVRAEDTAGVENQSSAQIGIQLDTAAPEAIEVIGIEAV